MVRNKEEAAGVRIAAIGALGETGPAAAPTIVELLRSPETLSTTSNQVREAAIETLRSMGVEAVPVLLKALKDPDAAFRLHVLRTLTRMGPAAKTAAPALVELLEEKNALGNGVIEALVAIGSDVVPEVVLALKSKDPLVRRHAVITLGLLGPKATAAIPNLIMTLKDADAQVATQSAKALEEIGPESVPALFDALRDEDNEAAAKVLVKLGPKAKAVVPDLIKVLQGGDTSRRRQAAVVLGMIGPEAKAAVPALTEAT